MSDFKPILPGTPEYDDAIKQASNIRPAAETALAVEYAKVELGDTRCILEHTALTESDKTSKLVFLFKMASMPVMTQLSSKLRQITEQLNIDGSAAEAGVSPLSKKQFDYVLFGIPTFRAEEIRGYILREVQELFRG